MLTKRQFLITMMLSSLLAATSLNAGETKDAKASFKEGIELFKQERYEEAAVAFRRANELYPSWKLLYNIGQSEAASGRYDLAMEAFQQYLVEGKDDVPVDRKDYVIKEMERLKSLVGYLEVDAADGARIHVDDMLRAEAPLLKPILVVGNVEHTVKVVYEDGASEEKRFSVWCGNTASVSFAELGKGEGASAMSGAAEGSFVAPGEGEAAEYSEGGPMGVWGWIGVGVGAAVLVAGGVTGGMVLSLDGDIQDNCPGGECPPPYHDDVDKRDALATTTNVLLPVGGAIALAGAVLLIVNANRASGSDDESRKQSASIRLEPFGAGVCLKGTF